MLVLQYTLIFTSVLALVALGGMFAERSGVINLGLEGIMVIGALAGSIASAIMTKIGVPNALNVIVSMGTAVFAGWAFSMLLGIACITFKADQTLVGTALNIMSTALAVVVARMYTKTPSSEIAYVSSMFKININIQFGFIVAILVSAMILTLVILLKTKKGKKILKNIDSVYSKTRRERRLFVVGLIGKIVGILAIIGMLILSLRSTFGEALDLKLEISWFLPMMIAIAIASYIFLYKTKFGMRLMACGEHPQAAGSVGINVYFQR